MREFEITEETPPIDTAYFIKEMLEKHCPDVEVSVIQDTRPYCPQTVRVRIDDKEKLWY